MAKPDVKMTLNQTYAAFGILDLGKCPDTGCIGTLTSVPTSGYLDSADFSYNKMGHLFAIRTSEMNYALLYMYAWGSGLPFKAFKWAYQPDGTPDFNKPVVSDVRSGFWTLLQPSSDSTASIVDFSELNKSVNNFQGKIVARDCYFTYDSIIAPYGVFYDSAAGDLIQSRYINGKTITLDHEGLFYLDSMMKLFTLQAPQTGYSKSCPIKNMPSTNGVYFIKTSENRYAALVKTGQYIGGIDRTYFYWAYQPDSGTKLYKNNLVQLPDSLSITVDVYSGRPNPTFKLIDPSGIGEIVRQVYLSVNTLLDSTRKRTGTILVNGNLGYRGLFASDMFGPAITTGGYAPTVDVYGGLITYYNVALISEIPPRLMYDKNSELEKLIIRVCCKNNLVSTDQYGAVRFCDLIPDSLKAIVPVFHEDFRSGLQKAFIALQAVPKGVAYRVAQAGRIRIELFDLKGKYVSIIADRYHDCGDYYFDFHSKSFAPGVYFVKCSRTGPMDRKLVFPLVIK
jgi:hypothetical protein